MKVKNTGNDKIRLNHVGVGELFEYKGQYYIKLKADNDNPYVAIQLDLTILIHKDSQRARDWLTYGELVRPYPHAYIVTGNEYD